MQLILHRSDVTGHNGETEESLAPAFDATETWQILYKRNSAGWADVLTTRLTAPEAHAFADRLRRHVREKSKRGLFRDHRRVYSRADGARLALLIGWLARAGAAGCVVWSDLSAAIDAPFAAVSPADIDPPPDPASAHPTAARAGRRTRTHACRRGSRRWPNRAGGHNGGPGRAGRHARVDARRTQGYGLGPWAMTGAGRRGGGATWTQTTRTAPAGFAGRRGATWTSRPCWRGWA